MERSIRVVNLGAIRINFEFINDGLPLEVGVNNILAEITDHRGIVIGIIPSPVLGSSVIVEQHPLKPFQVLLKHPFLLTNPIRGSYIKFKLGLIVMGFGFGRISSIHLDKVDHIFIVLVLILLSLLNRN